MPEVFEKQKNTSNFLPKKIVKLSLNLVLNTNNKLTLLIKKLIPSILIEKLKLLTYESIN